MSYPNLKKQTWRHGAHSVEIITVVCKATQKGRTGRSESCEWICGPQEGLAGGRTREQVWKKAVPQKPVFYESSDTVASKFFMEGQSLIHI